MPTNVGTPRHPWAPLLEEGVQGFDRSRILWLRALGFFFMPGRRATSVRERVF